MRRNQNAFEGKVSREKVHESASHGHGCFAYGNRDDAIVGGQVGHCAIEGDARTASRQLSAHGKRNIDGGERFVKDFPRLLL